MTDGFAREDLCFIDRGRVQVFEGFWTIKNGLCWALFICRKMFSLISLQLKKESHMYIVWPGVSKQSANVEDVSIRAKHTENLQSVLNE